MNYDERLKYLEEQYPDMPHDQAISVAVYCDAGWSWLGLSSDGCVELSRPATMETSERGYIRADGVFRNS